MEGSWSPEAGRPRVNLLCDRPLRPPNQEIHSGWDVKKGHAGRSSGHSDTQAEATKRAAEIVKNARGGEVRIHGKDGKIRDANTIVPGNDPYPPKG